MEEHAYAAAGVDIEAGDRAVELMKDAVKSTHSAHVLAGAGGFAGLVDASFLLRYRRPLLALSTDGVGTKVQIARALGIHNTIGQDMVAMVADDIAVCGAEPIAMTDYIACGKVVPETIAAIVEGIAAGCRLAGVSLVGGETAEHPGELAPDQYDVSGCAVGVVEADNVLGADKVRDGDLVIAMASSGLHSNGYSLVRKIVRDAGWSLADDRPELGRTLGEELLEPTRIYARQCLALRDAIGTELHAFAHVTGGGLPANLARVIPAGLSANVVRWRPPAIFAALQQASGARWEDLEDTLNLGIGMVALVSREAVPAARAELDAQFVPNWVVGEVTSRPRDGRVVQGTKGVSGGRVVMTGDYHV